MADSIEKLALNDRSLSIQRESSTALGQGFRMGFLGYLHVGITVDRLRQEYGSEVHHFHHYHSLHRLLSQPLRSRIRFFIEAARK
jgi:hypothetical protein